MSESELSPYAEIKLRQAVVANIVMEHIQEWDDEHNNNNNKNPTPLPLPLPSDSGDDESTTIVLSKIEEAYNKQPYESPAVLPPLSSSESGSSSSSSSSSYIFGRMSPYSKTNNYTSRLIIEKIQKDDECNNKNPSPLPLLSDDESSSSSSSASSMCISSLSTEVPPSSPSKGVLLQTKVLPIYQEEVDSLYEKMKQERNDTVLAKEIQKEEYNKTPLPSSSSTDVEEASSKYSAAVLTPLSPVHAAPTPSPQPQAQASSKSEASVVVEDESESSSSSPGDKIEEPERIPPPAVDPEIQKIIDSGPQFFNAADTYGVEKLMSKFNVRDSESLNQKTYTFFLNAELQPTPISDEKDKNVSDADYVRLFKEEDIEYCTFKHKGRLRNHGLIHTIHTAFQHHLELILKPDDLLTLIYQGISDHMSKYPRANRKHRIVFNNAENCLVLKRDGFKRKQPQLNDWESAVTTFYKQIRKNIPCDSIGHRFNVQFSTSTPINEMITKTILVSYCKQYFSHPMKSDCGIPKITLLGARQDWLDLFDQVQALHITETFPELYYWDMTVQSTIAYIVAQRVRMNMEVNQHFWRNIYKYESKSGTATVNGWITIFFPYLGTIEWRDYLEKKKQAKPKEQKVPAGNISTDKPGGKYGPLMDHIFTDTPKTLKSVPVDSFPCGIAAVPFKWNHKGQHINMLMHIGFDAPHIENNTVQSAYGLAMVENTTAGN